MSLPSHTIDEQGRLFELVNGVYIQLCPHLTFKKYVDDRLAITSDGDLYSFKNNQSIPSPDQSSIIHADRDNYMGHLAYLFLTEKKTIFSLRNLDTDQQKIESHIENVEYFGDMIFAEKSWYDDGLMWGSAGYFDGVEIDNKGVLTFSYFDRLYYPQEPIKLGYKAITSLQGIWTWRDDEPKRFRGIEGYDELEFIEGTEGCDNAHQLEILDGEEVIDKITVFLDGNHYLHYGCKQSKAEGHELKPVHFEGYNSEWKELREIDRKIYGITNSKEIFHISAGRDYNISLQQVDFPLFITSGKKTKRAIG